MKKILIKTYGFIGDILFASSIAEKLKQEQECIVDYCIGFPQPYMLLKNNPWINNVYLSKTKGPRVTIPDNINESDYTHIYELKESLHNIEPSILHQITCDVKNPSPEFKIYTDPVLDAAVEWELNQLNIYKTPVVGVVANWKQSTIKYTKQEYEAGLLNVNEILSHTHTNTRDVDLIIDTINKDCIIIPLGYDHTINQYHGSLNAAADYANQASIIKYCDIVIGQEGGMTNLAAGVGTKCIITTDFMHALYGRKGIMRQLENIKLGPAIMFPGNDHIHLDPLISDMDIVDVVLNNLIDIKK